MTDPKEMAWQMERIIHKYSQYEKRPQVYCKDIMLTQPEIHTIAIVGDHEGINVTRLAAMRGITKGAASQMVYKLVDKGLIKKQVSAESDAAVSLFLTKKGQQARKEHRKLHETMGTKFDMLLSRIPEDVKDIMMDFLRDFEEEIDNT